MMESGDLAMVLATSVAVSTAVALVPWIFRRRRRRTKASSAHGSGHRDTELQPSSSSATGSSNVLVNASRALVLHDEGGSELLAVSELARGEINLAQPAEALPVGGATQAALGRLLAPIPAATSAATAGRRTLELVFKPELQGRLRDGSARMMSSREVTDGFRGVVVDAGDGKAIGHASIRRAFNGPAVAAAAFQVASMLVAQKHLADIDEKLRGIQGTLKDIEAFLTAERRIGVQEDTLNIRRIGLSLVDQDLTDRDLNTYAVALDRVEANAMKAIRSAEEEMLRRVEQVRIVEVRSWTTTGMREGRAGIESHVRAYAQAQQEISLAVSLLFVVSQLRMAIGMSWAYSSALVEDVRALVSRIEERHPATMTTVLRGKALELRAKFATAGTEVAERAQLSSVIDETERATRESVKALTSHVESLTNRILEIEQIRSKPQRVIVTTDLDGRVTEMSLPAR